MKKVPFTLDADKQTQCTGTHTLTQLCNTTRELKSHWWRVNPGEEFKNKDKSQEHQQGAEFFNLS